MKKVLVPLAYFEYKEGALAPLNYVRETYINKLEAHNLAPLFVSHAMSEATLDFYQDMADGLLLTGGRDVKASQYDQDPHEESMPSQVRDDFEISLINKAIEEEIPVLGICRGCQVLAVAQGGSLHQHLPDLHKSEIHGESVDGPSAYDHVVNISHPAYVKKGTKLFDILGEENISVNSGHHQAVDDPGENMKISAVSPQGVTEAIEYEAEDYFCIGVQSHPEAQTDGALEDVFEAFYKSL